MGKEKMIALYFLNPASFFKQLTVISSSDCWILKAVLYLVASEAKISYTKKKNLV